MGGWPHLEVRSTPPELADQLTRRSPAEASPTASLPPQSRRVTPAGLETPEPGLIRSQIDSDAVDAPASRGLGRVWRSWLPANRSDMAGWTPRDGVGRSPRAHIPPDPGLKRTLFPGRLRGPRRRPAPVGPSTRSPP